VADGGSGDALKGTVQSLDALVHFGSPPDMDSPPFNLLDYGRPDGQVAALGKFRPNRPPASAASID
jgi:hypothetical protein